MKAMSNISKVYFLGIGGIGMSALARYFAANGKQVFGYDKTPSALTDQLVKEGIHVHFEDSLEHLEKEADLYIFTPAIPTKNTQLTWLKENDYSLYKRSEVLGLISQNHFCIAVAGSHGKTTVSSMIAHILNQGEGCTAFLGGIASNYQSNYVHTSNKYMVVEADEFDRSFLTLKPNIAVVTAIDSDHLEIYGSLENIEKEFIHFTDKINEKGTLILNENYLHIESSINKNLKLLSYGQKSKNDFYLKDYKVENGDFHFTITLNSKDEKFSASFGGIHNLENATAAIAVCSLLNMKTKDIQKGVASFQGIKRRFEKQVINQDYIYIDDYAHHPKEIKALIKSIRFLYPTKEILAVFQPHLFSRTENLCQEFADELTMADQVFLLPIYPAREEPIPGVTSKLILDKMDLDKKEIIEKDNLLDKVIALAKNKVLLTIGAGDIDRFVEPLKIRLNE